MGIFYLPSFYVSLRWKKTPQTEIELLPAPPVAGQNGKRQNGKKIKKVAILSFRNIFDITFCHFGRHTTRVFMSSVFYSVYTHSKKHTKNGADY
jgi:hypothetical protein